MAPAAPISTGTGTIRALMSDKVRLNIRRTYKNGAAARFYLSPIVLGARDAFYVGAMLVERH